MKTKTTVAKKDESSKDQRIAQLERSQKEIVSLVEGFEIRALPILLLLRDVLQDENRSGEFILHMPDRNIEYGRDGDAAGDVLDSMATELYECWNRIDALRMAARRPDPKFQDPPPQA